MPRHGSCSAPVEFASSCFAALDPEVRQRWWSRPHRPGRSGAPSLGQAPEETGCQQDEVPKPPGLAGSGAGPQHGLRPQPARRPAAPTAHSSSAPGQARQPASALTAAKEGGPDAVRKAAARA